jgi:hypothetical protein
MIGCTYAGEYNTWNSLQAGVLYTASSTIGTDYLTIRQGTSGGPVVAAGTTPVSFTPSIAGTYYIHVNTNSSCGTASGCRDITLAVPLPAIDMAATALAAPTTSACVTGAETVSITITNQGTATMNFATTPVTVSASVSGPNPATFTPVVISTGTLASGASQNVVVSSTYAMTAAGSYVFTASTSVTGDGYNPNNTMANATIVVGSGTATVSNNAICNGSSTTLTLTGYTGTIQWQSSTDGGVTFVNESGTGSTTASYTVMPSVNTTYRALVCGNPSNTVAVTVTSVGAPTTTGDTRCGNGIVNLSATGSGSLNWYTAATGGSLVNTGATYSPTLTATTTYYVSNVSGGTTGSVGMVNATTGAQQTSTNYLIFDVLAPAVLSGVHVYPGAAGNVVLELRTSGGTLITSATVPVTAADVNNKTFIPLNFNLTPGTGYWLAQGGGSVSMYRNEFGVTYPYTLPGIVSITGSAAGPDYYYFSYDWIVSTGCESTRVPVTGTVNPAPSITLTSSAGSTICSDENSVLTVSSSNPSYTYTWSPGAGLDVTTGTTVNATPVVATTYTVSAVDPTGCNTTASVAISVNPAPIAVATVDQSTICAGTSVQLDVNNTTPAATYTVGTGTITNSSTSYPAPYGNYYWGARHQFLITAAELTAAGLTAGPINSLAFDVTNTNAGSPMTNFEIKVGATASSALSVFETGLTTVHTSASYAPVTGWNTHSFSTAYNWDGTSNLVVETCFNNGSYVTNASVNQSATAFASSLYFYQDNTGVCANNTVNGTMNQRPNIRLSSPNPFTYSWSPAGSVSDPTIANPTSTPALTTTYTVTTTNTATGCNTESTVTVNVNALPAVAVTPASATVCAGGNTVLTASGADTYVWAPAAELSASTGDVVTATPTATTTFTVTGTDANSCVNTTTVVVTVNPLPVVTLDPIAPVCADAAMFTLTGESPAGGTFSGMGVSAGMFDAATAGAGTHTVTYSFTDGNGCSSSATQNVVVNALPVVTLASFSPVCAESPAMTLTGESPAGGTFSGTGVSAGSFDPAVAMAGTHAITYSYTDANGCSSSATESITVNPTPVVSFASMNSLCANGMPEVLNSASPAGGTYSGSFVSAGSFDPMMAGPGVHTITYSYTDANSCSASATTTITVNAAPVVTLAAMTPVCDNNTMFMLTGESPAGGTFSGTGVTGSMFDPMVAGAGTHAIVYTFTDANMCTSSATENITVNAAPSITMSSYSALCSDATAITLAGETPAGGTYSGTGVSGTTFDASVAGVGTHFIVYSVTDANGCSDTDSTSVVVNAIPVVELGSAIVQCGGSVTLDAGNAGSSYLWMPSGETTQMSTVTATGSYSVTVTNAAGCSASDVVSVTINPEATVSLGADTTICTGSTITFDAGAGFTSYAWTTGASTQTITVTSAGTYAVTVTNASGCSDTDSVTVDPCDGISESGDDFLVVTKPNPSNGTFTLVVNAGNVAALNIEIFDIQGRIVYAVSQENLNGEFTKDISIGQFGKGMYYLRLNTGSAVVTEKLIVQ